MFPVLGFTLALFLTLVLVPVLMRFAPKLGLVDAPGHRKVHAMEMPRCGGLAIAISFFISASFWLPLDRQMLSLFAAAFIIVLFGLLDDRSGLSYRGKFFGQIVAVLVLMQGGVLIERLPFAALDFQAPWLSYPLTFLFFLGAINAINLADGLDGLAAGISLLSLCLLAVFAYQTGQGTLALLALAMIGALAGFLRYNTHPARIFMGDTGSQFIGLMTASLAIMLTQARQCAYSPLLPLLVLGLPILDTLAVMAIRLYRRRSPFAADNMHIHHQFMAMGLRHYEVVALIYLLQIAMISSAYLLRFQADWQIALIYGLYALVLFGFLYWARSRQIRFRNISSEENKKEQRNLLLRRLDWYYYHSTRVLQWALAGFFLLAFTYVVGVSDEESRFGLWLAAGMTALALVLYRRPRLSSRLVAYLASVNIVYVMAMADAEFYSHWFVDGYLMLIVALLAIAIRITRKAEFRLDTQDLLVLFLVLVVPQLSFGGLSDVVIGRFTLRLAIVLYTCEYVLNKHNCNHWLMNGTAIAGVMLVAVLR